MGKSEQLSSVERTAEDLPTGLHLFALKESQIAELRTRNEAAGTFREEFTGAKRAFTKLVQETQKRVVRLNQTQADLDEQAVQLVSSRTCSAAYLRLFDELSLQSVPPCEILEFYKKCLTVNTRNCTSLFQKGRFVLQESIVNPLSGNREYQAMLDGVAGDPPSWFEGGKVKWREFVRYHAHFPAYLNLDLVQRYAGKNYLPTLQTADRLGFTLKDAFPDWLEELEEGIPERSLVERELAEDTQESRKVYHQLERIQQQDVYLRQTVNQKAEKVEARFQERRVELVPSIKNFSELVLYLGSMCDIHAHLTPEEAREKLMRRFLESHERLIDRESLALWIEKKLGEGGVIKKDARDLIDTNFRDLFSLLLQEMGAHSSDSPKSFREVKQTDKKAFNALNYDIKPFLALLRKDELVYLEEFIQVSQASPVEPAVWEMAELISLRYRNSGSYDAGNKTRLPLEEFRKFTTSWLRKNWQWAYRELQQVLSGGRVQEATPLPSDTPRVPPQEESSPVGEITTMIEETQQGNLRGWHLYYSTDRTVKEDSLRELGGGSVEEREQGLEQFIAGGKIPCSIKPASVIRAFEWLVTVPQEVERVRIRKDIEGTVFKKLKRGAVRIFYTICPEEKKIVFFIHQKKGYRYGF